MLFTHFYTAENQQGNSSNGKRLSLMEISLPNQNTADSIHKRGALFAMCRVSYRQLGVTAILSVKLPI